MDARSGHGKARSYSRCEESSQSGQGRTGKAPVVTNVFSAAKEVKVVAGLNLLVANNLDNAQMNCRGFV